MINDREGIPTDQMRLVSKGKQLSDDEQTLAQARVREGATVHLILRLR